MIKEYKLDLSNAQLPDWWPEGMPSVVLCRTGKWQKDIDVDERRYPGIKEKLVRARLEKFGDEGFDLDLPIGFDFDGLPLGAVLVEIKTSKRGHRK